MSFKCEYETRKKAVELYRDGMGFMEIIRTVQRSGFWMAKGLRRLKQLEDENRRLKRLVADLTLDKQMLQDALSKKF